MTEKAGGAKWDAPMLNAVDRFVESVGNEPKNAADFPEEIASETDSLPNCNRLISVRHVHGEVASLRDVEKNKMQRAPARFAGECACCKIDIQDSIVRSGKLST